MAELPASHAHLRHRVPLTGLLPASGQALTAHNAVIPRRMAELPASHAHLTAPRAVNGPVAGLGGSINGT